MRGFGGLSLKANNGAEGGGGGGGVSNTPAFYISISDCSITSIY